MPTLKTPYATKTLDLGTVKITMPADVPSPDRAAALTSLYHQHVKPTTPGSDWRTACAAEVPAAIVDDVAEAMEFMGSIVDDRRELTGGRVRLYSEGYWAHGF